MPKQIDFIFFDSGLGAIPYLLTLIAQSPFARCVYFADTANFPYGEKSETEIKTIAKKAIDHLLEFFSPAAIVIGCNTLSVTALDYLRASFPHILFVGTVPAIKKAAEITKNKRIGLLATKKTVDDMYVKKLTNNFASSMSLVKRGDSKLVNFVENNFLLHNPQEIKKALAEAYNFFVQERVDTIVLGCTHFVHVAKEFQELCGNSIQVIDSCEGVVRHALNMVSLTQKKDVTTKPEFYMSSNNVQQNEYYKAVVTQSGIVYKGVL